MTGSTDAADGTVVRVACRGVHQRHWRRIAAGTALGGRFAVRTRLPAALHGQPVQVRASVAR